MNTLLVYAKTAQGYAALEDGAGNLSATHANVLSAIDGISSVQALTRLLDERQEQQFIEALESLESSSLVRISADVDHQLLQQQLSVPLDPLAQAGAIPSIDVIELTPQESVQAWAEAQRGARALQEHGFYAAEHPHLRPGGLTGSAGIRVLVVEDDDMTAELLEFLLREHDFYVKRVADGTAAIAELQRRPTPDLVLLDVIMPGRDGFDVLKEIRGDVALQSMPVIMVTSKISDEHVMRGLKEGADGYVFKPFQWETLYGCIKDVCRL